LIAECVDELAGAMDEAIEVISKNTASLDAQKQTLLNEEVEEKKHAKEWLLSEIGTSFLQKKKRTNNNCVIQREKRVVICYQFIFCD
jgi:hypothetical protein